MPVDPIVTERIITQVNAAHWQRLMAHLPTLVRFAGGTLETVAKGSVRISFPAGSLIKGVHTLTFSAGMVRVVATAGAEVGTEIIFFITELMTKLIGPLGRAATIGRAIASGLNSCFLLIVPLPVLKGIMPGANTPEA